MWLFGKNSYARSFPFSLSNMRPSVMVPIDPLADLCDSYPRILLILSISITGRFACTIGSVRNLHLSGQESLKSVRASELHSVDFFRSKLEGQERVNQTAPLQHRCHGVRIYHVHQSERTAARTAGHRVLRLQHCPSQAPATQHGSAIMCRGRESTVQLCNTGRCVIPMEMKTVCCQGPPMVPGHRDRDHLFCSVLFLDQLNIRRLVLPHRSRTSRFPCGHNVAGQVAVGLSHGSL